MLALTERVQRQCTNDIIISAVVVKLLNWIEGCLCGLQLLTVRVEVLEST